MIEYVRRSLIQKAIEGDMKILAAGTLVDETAVNFSAPGEGKTTLTMICHSKYVGSNYPGFYDISGILKGTGTVYFSSDSGYFGNTAQVTANSIKQVGEMDGCCNISYIVFEVDE